MTDRSDRQNDSAYTQQLQPTGHNTPRGVRTVDRRTRNPQILKHRQFTDFRYTVHACAIMLLTDWLHTFIEIIPDNRTDVGNKSEILYSDKTYERNTTLSRPRPMVICSQSHDAVILQHSNSKMTMNNDSICTYKMYAKISYAEICTYGSKNTFRT